MNLRTANLVSVVAGLSMVCGGAMALPMPLPAISRTFDTNTDASKGKLVWQDGQSHDFGTIWDHENVHHDFWFENQGTEPISIERFQPTCGCTLGGIYTSNGDKILEAGEQIRQGEVTVAPGEKAYVRVIFDPTGRRAQQHKTVKLFTSAGNARQTDLRFSAKIDPVLIVEPSLINFQAIQKGQADTQILKIAGRSEDFEVKLDELSNSENFRVTVGKPEPMILDDTTYYQSEIKVEILPGAKVGREVGSMKFVTNDPRREEVDLRIVARVIGDLTSRPPRLAMGAVAPNEKFTHVFDIVSKTATPFDIQNIEVTGSLSGADVEFEPISNGGSAGVGKADAYRVTMHAEAGASSRQSGMIRVLTGMDDEPVVEIPYSAWVRRDASNNTNRINVPAGSIRSVPAKPAERVTASDRKTSKGSE